MGLQGIGGACATIPIGGGYPINAFMKGNLPFMSGGMGCG
jgi:hypothetical protein